MSEWLVRTTKNLITGPYTQGQVSRMILDGRLALDDEVCPENSYWMFLYERGEIRDFLGIDVPLSTTRSNEELDSEEVTEVKTGQKIDQGKANGDAFSFKFSAEEITETTAILKRVSEEAKANRGTQVYDHSQETLSVPIDLRSKKRHTPSYLQVSVWGLTFFIGILIAAIFYLLNQHP